MTANPNLSFDEYYFNGAPYGYSDYASPLTYLSERPAQMVDQYVARLAVTGKTVLIVGCGFGYTVQELRNRGVSAFGLDISDYAHTQNPLPQWTIVGDARLNNTWQSARSLAGLKGNQKFGVVITEDLLSCMSDSDAQTIGNFSTQYSQLAVHLVVDNPYIDEWYNVHTPAEWKTIVGGTVIKRFSWEQF